MVSIVHRPHKENGRVSFERLDRRPPAVGLEDLPRLADEGEILMAQPSLERLALANSSELASLLTISPTFYDADHFVSASLRGVVRGVFSSQTETERAKEGFRLDAQFWSPSNGMVLAYLEALANLGVLGYADKSNKSDFRFGRMKSTIPKSHSGKFYTYTADRATYVAAAIASLRGFSRSKRYEEGAQSSPHTFIGRFFKNDPRRVHQEFKWIRALRLLEGARHGDGKSISKSKKHQEYLTPQRVADLTGLSYGLVEARMRKLRDQGYVQLVYRDDRRGTFTVRTRDVLRRSDIGQDLALYLDQKGLRGASIANPTSEKEIYDELANKGHSEKRVRDFLRSLHQRRAYRVVARGKHNEIVVTQKGRRIQEYFERLDKLAGDNDGRIASAYCREFFAGTMVPQFRRMARLAVVNYGAQNGVIAAQPGLLDTSLEELTKMRERFTNL